MKVKCSCGKTFDLPDWGQGEEQAKRGIQKLVNHLLANPTHDVSAITEEEYRRINLRD